MLEENYKSKSKDELIKEIVKLQSKFDEAQETLNAIQNAEIDAIVTPSGSDGPKVYTLESADYLYRNIVQEMNEGVATLTYNGTIFYSNAQLAILMEVPLEKMSGQNFTDFVLSKDLEYYQTIFERGLKTRSNGEINIQTLNGNIIPVHISINTLDDLKGVYIVITDLSEQKHHEKLKYAHEKLNISLEELKRSNYELQQFAYVASHDLQEPLRMVSSFSQLLEKRYKDRLDEDANEFIGFIVDGAQHMKLLIDDLLTYSRVTSHAKEFENVDLENVLDVVFSNLSFYLEENKVIITKDSLPVVFADPSQMGQIFQNLISNAIKFHNGSTPKIHISSQKSETEWIFAVADNGIGIDPNYQEQIFEVFKRLHTRNEYPGSGIGLSICQKIIQRHGGRIWVESKKDVGSTFFFTLPIQKSTNKL